MRKSIIAASILAASYGSYAQKGGQVLQPTKSSEVQAPIPGAPLSKEYVQAVGKMAYIWGWPLVNMHNREAQIGGMAPYRGYMGGVLPVAPSNQNTMLHDYLAPEQRFITSPNQDVVYGLGFLNFKKDPAVIIQIPDFGNRFWVYQIVDQRSNSFATVGSMYNTKPGFYMFVGPDWKGEKPAGVEAVYKSPTNIGAIFPRVFMDDTPQDKKDIQKLINQIVQYPATDFTGKMQTINWTEAKTIPDPNAGSKGETAWVVPEKFFEQLPVVMEEVPALPGEEAMYAWIKQILDATKDNPELQKALVDVAVETEKEIINPMFEFRNNGVEAGNGWRTQKNAAEFGYGYFQRTATAKGNMFSNIPFETMYFGNDFDSSTGRLTGGKSYEVTFKKGETPPVNGFWSLTLYNEQHFFYPNEINRFSLGTKNKDLVYNTDGSLTIYVQPDAPKGKLKNNWLPSPKSGVFSLYIRAYGPKEAIYKGTWTPPLIKKTN
ncbi:DUF1254 domain-containing protein [Flavobacterium agrisoli]|uniref:DUF1254 domain-containing protein n=1 Tax=Flavobacterium agrisoli TaxID=2793066 RepID=A0A934PM33_9FLAO|nr:DUF1254 domain-containing protein [Flavobacterium agrisoli]MBK0370057.1 DUF1254 domain-containing protein [Flavobacterium agrisoli]